MKNEPRSRERAFDLVCGMELELGEIKHATEHKGESYYFCGESCRDHFVNDPEKYVGQPIN